MNPNGAGSLEDAKGEPSPASETRGEKARTSAEREKLKDQILKDYGKSQTKTLKLGGSDVWFEDKKSKVNIKLLEDGRFEISTDPPVGNNAVNGSLKNLKSEITLSNFPSRIQASVSWSSVSGGVYDFTVKVDSEYSINSTDSR